MTARFRLYVSAAALAATATFSLAQDSQKPQAGPQPSMESLHRELAGLEQQIAEMRASGAPAQRVREIGERYAAIRRALGGDDPVRQLQPGTPAARQSGTGSAPHPLLVPPSCAGSSVTTLNFSGAGGPLVPAQGYQTQLFPAVVSGAGYYLWDVDLTTFITHTFNGDIDMRLRSPAGTLVTITTDNGDGNDNVFDGTVWDDDANDPVTEHVFFDMTLASPLSPEGRLTAFRGEDPNGTWTLEIYDDAPNDFGSLNAWSLDIQTLVAPPGELTSSYVLTPSSPIPDNGTLNSTMSVGGLATYLYKVVLYLEIPHTASGDLDIRLISPNGTSVVVSTDNGGLLDNVFNGTTFDTHSTDAVSDHYFYNMGVATLLSPEGSFENFRGQTPNGIWTLSVTDDRATDVGTLVRWDLTLTTIAPPSSVGPTNFAGTPGPLPDYGTVTTTPSVFTATVSSAGPYLWDVDLTTPIIHPYGADLDVKLTSPAGTTVTLSTDNGGYLGYVFNGTLWDDDADDPVTDYAYVNNNLASPLSPEGRLSAFRGEDPNGTWTLTITNDYPDGYSGSVGSWKLDISTLGAAPSSTSSTFSRTPNLAISPLTPNTVMDTMAVSGLGSSTLEVEVYLEVAHTFSSDLDIALVSPAGTLVALTTDNGGSLNNGFNGTLFDASVTDAVSDHVYTNMVAATPLSPEGSLENLMGQDPNGNWTLIVADDTAGEGGNFARWDLTIKTCWAPPGTAYCSPGLGGVIACPCGNAPAAAGQGCSNSLGAGASISGTGSASIAADTLVLSASGIRSAGASCAGNSPSLSCILLQGSVNAPVGVGFVDGVRCFAGVLKRLQVAASVAGVFTSSGSVAARSAAHGDPLTAGMARYYGIWYRDSCASWACPAPSNSDVSDSYAITWNP